MTYRTDERPGLLHFSDTQLYWCNITMDPRGPDNAPHESQILPARTKLLLRDRNRLTISFA